MQRLGQAALLAMLWICGAVGAQTLPVEASRARVGPETFAIFPWDILKASKASYEQAKECGFNLAGFVDPENLDLVQAAGLKCFVRSDSIKIRENPRISDDQIASVAMELVQRAASHPAVFGYHLLDEPAPALMPAVVRWTKAFEQADLRQLQN